MNQHERNQIAELWSTIGAMYGKDFSRPVLKMMIDAVEDLPFEKVMQELFSWTRKAKQNRSPFPAEIREAINPPMNDRDVANELCHKITRTIAKHGYAWSQGVCVGEMPDGSPRMAYLGRGGEWFNSFDEAVVSEIGEVGLRVIRSRGWSALACSSNEMDEGQYIAQLRDQIESSMRLGNTGVSVENIKIPSREKSEGLQQAIVPLLRKIKNPSA